MTTGSNNTGIGRSVMSALTTGSDNTSIGSTAGKNNATGSQNTFIGSLAGVGVAANSNTGNTGIGYASGTALTTGGNNVLIGLSAGSTITTGSANIIIGFSIAPPTITTSNFMSIGNLIFSAGVDGTGTTLSSGNIGIGVAAPGTKLHVIKTDAGTNAVINTTTISHRSTATPAANYGTGLILAGDASDNTEQSMTRLRAYWNTATVGSRKAYAILSAFDTAERDAIGIGASGTAALLGFYPTVAAAPIIQPASANQAAVVTTPAALASYGFTQAQADSIVTLVNQLRSDLVALGLIKGAA